MAQDINVLTINGRIVRDCENKVTASGLSVCNFSIASNHSVKKNDKYEDEASYFPCSLVGSRADSLKPYLVKGRQVTVMGELRQDRWELNGEKKSKIYILARDVQLLAGAHGSSDASEKGEETNTPVSSGAKKPEPAPQAEEYDDSDIPF